MKVLVTGGAGFIGFHTVNALIGQGYSVIVIDNLSTGRLENVNSQAEFIQMDITSHGIGELFAAEKIDFVIHLAAQTEVPKSLLAPDYDCQVNIWGTLNIMEAARKHGVKRVVFSSSAAVYGDVTQVPVVEDYPGNPNSFYGLSKATAEKYLRLYSECYGIEHMILRFANVYGERQGDGGEGGVVSIFARQFKAGDAIRIFGDGGQTRDFVYAGDVAKAVCLSLRSAAANKTYNISTASETSINHLVDMFSMITGKTADKIYLPARNGDIYRSALANDAAIDGLGWRPEVGVADGLTATYQAVESRI